MKHTVQPAVRGSAPSPVARGCLRRRIAGRAGVRSAVFLLTLLGLGSAGWGAAGSMAAHAQVTPANSGHPGASDSSRPAPTAASGPQVSHATNLVRAEDQDDEAAYRHSATVRALGKWLHLAPEPAARLFEFLNFALLFGTLLVVLVQRLPRLLRNRKETIQKQLADARTATEQADARLSQVEQRLSRLDQEIAAIRSQAERESVEDEARIKDSMEEERRRIVQSAEQELDAAAAAARRGLKRFAGELAVERAAGKIALTEENDRGLIREFARDLGKSGANGGRN